MRPGEGWRPSGPELPRPRAGFWYCSCSVSRHPPRRWLVTSRWGADERPSAVFFTRRGSAACGRVVGGRAHTGRWWSGPAAGLALPPPHPCLVQCSAVEVGLPRPPQRPNERHRGCGGRRTSSADPAPIPPATLPSPRGTLRGPNAHRDVPPGRCEPLSADPISKRCRLLGQRAARGR